MPSAMATPKRSLTAAMVAPDIDLKDVDEVNTHTSESVCSSSGTDADTSVIAHSTPASIHPNSLPPHSAMADPARQAVRVSSNSVCSPTSPVPCGFPEDFVAASSAAATAMISLGCTPTAVSPDGAVTPLPMTASSRKTPAPPPPIDFCAPAVPLPHAATSFKQSALREKGRAESVRVGVGDSDLLSPVTVEPQAVLLATTSAARAGANPASAAADRNNSSGRSSAIGIALKPPMSLSALHAHSGRFNPLEGGCMANKKHTGVKASPAGGNVGHSLGLEGSFSVRNTLSPISTSQQDCASSCDYIPTDPLPTPSMIGFCFGDEPHDGLGTSSGIGAPSSGGGMPKLTSSVAHHNISCFADRNAGNANAYDMHWHDTGASSYHFSHFTSAVPNYEANLGGGTLGCGGGGPLVEDGYTYAPPAPSEVGHMHDYHNGVAPSPHMASGRSEGGVGMNGGGGGGLWTSSSVSMAPDCMLPTYSEPQPPFFSDGPPCPLPAANLNGDFDCSDCGNVYDDGGAALGELEMRFGSYVPQDVQCVEHLEDLDYICQGILAEAAVMRLQYQRLCRERQYLAEDPFADDELDNKMVIALDLEGRSLSRHGSICIITLATYSTVYIIDMVLLGDQALGEHSALKAVLESNSITKLMFDCRADCDALFFLYQVRLRNVCDLQISSCFALFPFSRRLPSMKGVFRALGLFADEDTDIKNAGRHLFNPNSGGSFDRWEERPLPDILLQYCAVDVKYFFVAKLMLWNHLEEGFCLGEARLDSVCAGNFSSCSQSNAMLDFAVQ
ncbi:hypothetical protein ABL78_0004 [Leptomonas seymouri]|uniref:3'-5' exonuclease domain-containing protein n=1 Tax=Leptomonas seymouri TaxID=5684 RepID=A0A0N1IMV9_LEPSE|nr:hypothetical protein ABL78_0004 [Leptomonas seymouri]|eukprot:KPI90771.1 hypothetical protein ABL78_0004 [Leptomonas seymouri]